MDLHCQVKPRWVSGSLKGEIGSQTILTGVWTSLCRYLLFSRENDIRVDPGAISSNIPVAVASIGHQEFSSQLYSWWGGLYKATALLLRGYKGLQIEEVTLRPETVSESLVWAFASVNQKLGLCRSEKNLYILADTAWKESPASCICWSYCDHKRWHRRDW